MVAFFALGFLAVFLINVILGKTSGSAPLSNVAEMVLLFCASIAFVIEILRREAKEEKSKD